MRARRFVGALAVVWVGLAVGLACGSSESGSGESAEKPAAAAAKPAPAAQAAASDAAAKEEATQIFSTRCYTCHGSEGAGDGPGSAGLTPAPRNFQDAAWQASVTDEHLTQIILYGGAAVGKSPMMPGNPDLNGRPAVVAALVEHIRSLAK